MLSREDLADIVKDEVDNHVKKGEKPVVFYYILSNGEIYPTDNYDEEVAKGKRSANDIYALVFVSVPRSLDVFLFYVNYLDISSVSNIVEAYLGRMGFIPEYSVFSPVFQPPTPNLKYYIDAIVGYNHNTPKYLVVNIYDIDALARTFHIPQIVEKELGNKPRKITIDDVLDIYRIVAKKQPILAGYTYVDALRILDDYSVLHYEKYKGEAYKIDLAYMNLFPTPYRVCYEWKMKMFIRTSCLKLVLRSF